MELFIFLKIIQFKTHFERGNKRSGFKWILEQEKTKRSYKQFEKANEGSSGEIQLGEKCFLKEGNWNYDSSSSRTKALSSIIYIHSHIVGISPICGTCGNFDETIVHIISECSVWVLKYYIYAGYGYQNYALKIVKEVKFWMTEGMFKDKPADVAESKILLDLFDTSTDKKKSGKQSKNIGGRQPIESRVNHWFIFILLIQG